MRVTNSMLSNNMLLNMNKNLKKLNTLENTFATGKKIQLPSDNPIIAGKSLKLRTNLYENEQYKTNVDDAESWMSITESAIKNVNDIMSRMRDLCVTGSTETLGKSEREKIGEEIKQLREQLVQESNATNAGRYIFAGYKTDKKIMFDTDVSQKAKIACEFGTKEMEQLKVNDNYLYKLPYSNIENTIKLKIDAENYSVGDPVYNIVEKSISDSDAYEPPAPGAIKTIHLIKETGELIFNEAHYTTITDPMEVQYEKDGFKSGDLNPIHYFDTIDKVTIGGSVGLLDASNQVSLGNTDINDSSINTITVGGIAPSSIIYGKSTDGILPVLDQVKVDMDTGMITAGPSFAVGDSVDIDYYEKINRIEDENIDYEVSKNTKITINTQAKNLITVKMIGDIDRLINNIDNMEQQELTEEMSGMLTKIDNHSKNTLKCQAGLGSKMNRLEMITSRLENDKINYTQLKSDNEDADLAETITKLKTQQTIYEASLSAGSKIIQLSLVDFMR
ncbi:MAG TPA: flagellar hook-associated protein 3 [Clostridiales bacterium]|nr:MAG: hypothetical protein A2Y18_08020 [Clostridiales bacterium GWD2_32_19]HCC07863.1 flagellar hook-associated protein 3 [Clostridiales bacterium]